MQDPALELEMRVSEIRKWCWNIFLHNRKNWSSYWRIVIDRERREERERYLKCAFPSFIRSILDTFIITYVIP